MYTPGKKSKFYTFIILLLTSISSGFADHVKIFDRMEFTGHKKDSSIIGFLSDVAKQQQQELELFFDGRIRAPILIRLAESDAAYTRYTGGRIPDWSGAVTFPGRREIILKPGRYFDPEQYRETLIHELAHIYMNDVFENPALPLWMAEGCAMHLSKPALTWNELIVLGNAFSNEQIAGLETIDELLRFGPSRAQLAYLQSFSAVRYLVEVWGNDTFRAIMQDCSSGSGLDPIFLKHLQIGLADFEDQWYRETKGRLKWIIFLQVENILWLSLVLISFAVFALIRLRNRRTVKKWQETDDLI